MGSNPVTLGQYIVVLSDLSWNMRAQSGVPRVWVTLGLCHDFADPYFFWFRVPNKDKNTIVRFRVSNSLHVAYICLFRMAMEVIYKTCLKLNIANNRDPLAYLSPIIISHPSVLKFLLSDYTIEIAI